MCDKMNDTDLITKYSREILPPTYLTLLLILSEEPRHGYQINKVIEERGMRSWVDIKFSSVYKGLDELAKRGLIEGEKEEAKVQQSKKIFSITKLGQRVLKKQLELLLKNPPRPKWMFDLGLAGIYLLNKTDALAALESYKASLTNRLKFYDRALEELDRTHDHYYIVKALFERPKYQFSGELSWVNEFVEHIKRDETSLR